MLTRLALAAFCAFAPVLAGPLAAQTTTETAPATEVSVPALATALRLDELFAVLRDEGISYGDQLQADMFSGGSGSRWRQAVSAIYDTETLRSGFVASLEADLGQDPDTLAAILDFYSTDLGKRVVGLEIDARKAFLDVAQEEAARVAAEDRFAARDPKVKLIDRFIVAGDMVEMNVAGALSGNLAFMTGMSETGAYGSARPAEDMMADVWAQEDQIRADTTSWLHAYLGLAYDPLTEAELAAYADFMESPAGKRLNAALFVAFEQTFRQVSYDLGRAAGLASLGRDI
jgi:Uncharacterized protein conserved in bacteria (DUF2059)